MTKRPLDVINVEEGPPAKKQVMLTDETPEETEAHFWAVNDAALNAANELAASVDGGYIHFPYIHAVKIVVRTKTIYALAVDVRPTVHPPPAPGLLVAGGGDFPVMASMLSGQVLYADMTRAWQSSTGQEQRKQIVKFSEDAALALGRLVELVGRARAIVTEVMAAIGVHDPTQFVQSHLVDIEKPRAAGCLLELTFGSVPQEQEAALGICTGIARLMRVKKT